MGYKWDKPRKLVSLITVAGQRRPQSLIAIKCHIPYRVIVVYSGCPLERCQKTDEDVDMRLWM